MAISAGTVTAELILDAGKFEAGLARAEKQAGGFVSRLEGVGSKMDKIGSALTRKVTVPIVGLFTTISTGLIKAGIERTAFTESTRVALETMMGDAKKAKAFIDDLADFARKTPFAFPDLAASARNMIAFGMNAQDVIPTLTAIGDAVAGVGGGKAELEGISDAFGKIQASGKLTAAEIHSLSRHGIPALQILANQFGITAEEMRDKISKGAVDADTAIKMLVKGIEEGTTGVAGNTARFAGMMDKIQFTWSGALDKMRGAWSRAGEEMVRNHMPKMKATINAITEAIKEAPQIIGPVLEDIMDIVMRVINTLAKLDPETKTLILRLLAIAAAAGPVIKIGSSLFSVGTKVAGIVGKIIPLLTGAKAATAAAGTAAAAAGSGFSLMGAATAAAGLLLNPVVLGVAAVAAGAIFLAKKLSEDAVPAVNVFGDECSKATKRAVGGFLELESEADGALKQLAWGAGEVTQEMAADLIGKYDAMKDSIVNKLDEQKEEALASIQDMLSQTRMLTYEEQDEMIRMTNEMYEEKKRVIEEGNARIAEILNEAAEEKRKIYDWEQREINDIQQKMKEEGIKVFSESEKEQLAIMERLRMQSEEISARQAADIVKNSIKQKEETIKEAEEEFEKRLRIAAELRAQGGEEAEDLADKIIAEATRQKEETIKDAEEMHKRIVTEAQNQAKEHYDAVDWETGEVKSKFRIMKEKVTGTVEKLDENTNKTWAKMMKTIKEESKGGMENAKEQFRFHGQQIVKGWERLKGDAKEKFGGMKKNISDKMEETGTAIRDKWDAVMEFFGGIDLSGTGRDMIQGLIGGIKSKAGDLVNAAKGVVNDAIQGAKNLLGISSPSRVFLEFGKQTGEGYALGLKYHEKAIKLQAEKIAKIAITSTEDTVRLSEWQLTNMNRITKEKYGERYDATKKYLDKARNLEEVTARDEIAIWQYALDNFRFTAEERQRVAIELRDAKQKVYGDMKAACEKYASDVQAINQKLAEEKKKLTEQRIAEEKRLTEEYEKAVDARAKSLYSFAGLFDELKDKEKVTGQQLLKSLKGQVVAFADWTADIQELASRGIDKGLLQEIQEMGPKAAAEVKALLSLTQAELKEYEGLWAEKNRLAREQATKELEGLKQATDAQIRGIRKDTAKQIDELNAKTAEQLEALTQEWQSKMQEISQGTKANFEILNKDMPDIGRELITGLIEGLSSTEGALYEKAAQIANTVVDTVKNALQICSPSRVFMKFGRNIDEGLIAGIDSLVSKVARASRKMVDAAMPGALAMPDIPMGSFYRGAPSCRVTDTDIDYDSLGAIASGGTTFNGPIYVTIPAKDIKEMQDVTDFFDRLSQAARAGAT